MINPKLYDEITSHWDCDCIFAGWIHHLLAPHYIRVYSWNNLYPISHYLCWSRIVLWWIILWQRCCDLEIQVLVFYPSSFMFFCLLGLYFTQPVSLSSLLLRKSATRSWIFCIKISIMLRKLKFVKTFDDECSMKFRSIWASQSMT